MDRLLSIKYFLGVSLFGKLQVLVQGKRRLVEVGGSTLTSQFVMDGLNRVMVSTIHLTFVELL